MRLKKSSKMASIEELAKERENRIIEKAREKMEKAKERDKVIKSFKSTYFRDPTEKEIEQDLDYLARCHLALKKRGIDNGHQNL